VRLAASDEAGALDAARQGYQADPKAEGPAMLALELSSEGGQPQADALLQQYLSGKDASVSVRGAYARSLAQDGRYDEASQQLQSLTQERPDQAEAWLLLGTLQAQARKDQASESSVKRYLALSEKMPEAAPRARGEAQAYFVLAQLAERRKDYAAAESWLDKVDSPDDETATQLRRAALLARQGKLDEARALVQQLPDDTADQRRQKLQAEVQLLRDAKRYQEAYDLLAKASAAAPSDGDLIYDQAMMAEKLNRLDDMERLLRQLMAIAPDNQNAYNALGYSLADRNVRLEEARTLIRKAVSLAPDDPFIADSLGWVEFRLGNHAEATRILEAAYKKRPDAEIAAHLGEVLWVSGQRDRAVTIWKEGLNADSENETLQQTLKRLRVKP
jgi:Flp pilus assembly protein TadD